jgi:hypothetical protein
MILRGLFDGQPNAPVFKRLMRDAHGACRRCSACVAQPVVRRPQILSRHIHFEFQRRIEAAKISHF